MKVLYRDPDIKEKPYIRLDNREIDLVPDGLSFSADLETEKQLSLKGCLPSLIERGRWEDPPAHSFGKITLSADTDDEILSFGLARISGQVIEFKSLLPGLGYDIPGRTLIPDFRVSLTALQYDIPRAEWTISIGLEGSKASLVIQIGGSLFPVLGLHSEGGDLPSLAHCLGNQVFSELKPLLPSHIDSNGITFSDKLGNSQLTGLALQVNFEDGTFLVYAAGEVLGIEGSLSLSRISLPDTSAVSLQIKSGKPQQASMEDVLGDLFGISVNPEISWYLPKMKFALHELSYDQIESSFYLAGSIHQGVVSPVEQGYELTGELSVEWQDGWKFELVLDADKHPVTLKKLGADLPFALDTLGSFLPADLLNKIGATTFYQVALSFDTQNQAISFHGVSNLLGVFLTDTTVSYSRERGLDFSATIDYEPLSIGNLLDLLGVTTNTDNLPLRDLALSLTAIRFSQHDRSVYLACRIRTAGGEADINLALAFEDGFQLRMEYHSEKDKLITIKDAIDSTMPKEWVALLPKPGEKDGFVSKFNGSSLSDLYLDLDTHNGRFLFGAAGNFMGMEGSVAISVISILDQRFINLNITGEKKNAFSIPSLLRNFLCIEVPVEDFIPTMEFALLEMSFDSSDKSFYLSGSVSQGEKSTTKYKLTAELSVEWQDGVQLDMNLTAGEVPVTLAALQQDLPFSLEEISKFLPSKTVTQLRATAFHNFSVSIDTSKRSLRMGGTINLFGRLLTSGSFSYTQEEGLAFDVSVYGDPLSIKEIVGLLGLGENLTDLPNIKVGLREMSFDPSQRHFLIKGIVAGNQGQAEIGLDIKVLSGGVEIALNYFSDETAPLTAGHLIESALPSSQEILPKTDGKENKLLQNLKNSHLTDLQLNLRTEEKELRFYARGEVLGMKGEIGFSILNILGNRLVFFHLYGDEKVNGTSLPEMLRDTLGLAIPPEVDDYLPKMKFAFTELSFDQLERSFRIRGTMTQSSSNPAAGEAYCLEGKLEVGWRDGVQVDLELDAREAPVTLAALRKDLPFFREGILSYLPEAIGEKIDATAFHYFSLAVDTSVEVLAIKGTANLFGKLLVSATFEAFRVDGETFIKASAAVLSPPLELRKLPEMIGLVSTGQTPIWLEWVPQIAIGLEKFELDQQKKQFALIGEIVIGNEASIRAGIGIKKVNDDSIVNLFFKQGEKPVSLIEVFNKVVKGVQIPSLPAKLDLTLNYFDLYVNTTTGGVHGGAEGIIRLLDTSLTLTATSQNAGESWTFSLETATGELSLTALILELLNLKGVPLLSNLPEVKVKVDKCSFSTAGNFKLEASSDMNVPIEIAGGLEAKLAIQIEKKAPSEKITGKLGGTLTYGKTTFGIDLLLAEGVSTLIATAENVNLSDLVSNLIGAELPEGIPKLSIKELSFTLDSKKNLEIKGDLSVEWEFPFGSDVKLEVTEATFKFIKNEKGKIDCSLKVEGASDVTEDIRFKKFSFIFTYNEEKKEWTLGGSVTSTVYEKEFTLGASYFSDKKNNKELFQLEWKSPENEPLENRPLVEVKGIFSLNVTHLALTVERGNKAKWDFTATSDFMLYNPSSTTDPKDTLFELKAGELTLTSDTDKTSLEFKAVKAEVYPMEWFPVFPEGAGKALAVCLNGLTIERHKKDKKWEFSMGAELSLRPNAEGLNKDVYKFIEKAFPVDDKDKIRKVVGKLKYSNGLSLKLTNNTGLVIPNLFKDLKVRDPDDPNNPAKEKILLDIGDTFVLLKEIEVTLGSKFSLKATFGFALPSRLNDLFFDKKSALYGLFKVYDGTSDHLTTFTLEAGTERFEGSIEKVNLIDFDKAADFLKKDIDLEKGFKNEDKHVVIDLDALIKNTDKASRYGTLRLEKPTVQIDLKKGAFKLGGGFEVMEVEEEVNGQPVKVTKLTIPFLPVKKLLEALNMSKAAAYVPKGIPIRSIDFFTVPPGGTKRTLSLDELENYLKDLLGAPLGKSFSLPSVFKQAVSQAGSILDNLPERFKEYLSIHLPPNFSFALNITPEGSFSFSAEVKKPKTAGGDFKDYLQLLVPGPPGQLYGIRLRKIGLGSALSNTAVRLDLSAEIDMFDLLTLGSSLVLPDKKTAAPGELKILLPDRSKFQRTFEVRDLIVFIVFVQTGTVPIPVPIPVYMSKINLKYFSLEGTEAAFLGKLRGNLDFATLMKELAKFPGFFTNKEEYLTVDPYPLVPERINVNSEETPKQNNTGPEGLALTVSPIYVQLPGFMGYETRDNLPEWHNILIGTKDSFIISLLDVVKLIMNTGKGLILETAKKVRPETIPHAVVIDKKRPLNYLIEYLPLKNRMAIRKIKLFFLFDLHVAWAFATPDEFSQVVYPKMLEAYRDAKDTAGNKLNLPAPQQTSPASYLLDLLVKEDDISLPPGEDQGIVLFLRGGLDIAGQIQLEGAIGLSVSERKGFRTGIALKGKVFDWIETESFFFVKLNPQSKDEFIKVLGTTFLKIFDRDVLKGHIEVSPKGMSFAGMLDAFPADFPIQLKGFASGRIAKEEFYLKAAAGLQLGQFRAGFVSEVDIRKDSQLFTIDMAFANASFHLALNREVSGDISQTRARMSANVFNLLALQGELLIKREPHRLSVDGFTSLNIPQVNLLYLEMNYSGEINAEEGFISFQATLNANSFILSQDCRPSGGAAFKACFLGENAGDFTLTIGGYHPAFIIPNHYPQVPRLGIYWRIDPYTHISGEAYFALTPGAIMAGAKLSMIYERGNIRFWFTAYAHFLCQWKPIRYEAAIGVSVGASYTIWFFRWSKTISVNVDATLHLWGPPTGGYIEVHLPIIKITIPFGKDREEGVPQIRNWEDFKKAFRIDRILTITPTKGVVTSDHETWIVRADELSYTITTAVPVSDSLNIKSLNLLGIGSLIEIKLRKGNQEIPLSKNELKSSVPAALWGNPTDNPLDSSQSLIKNVITGFHIPEVLPEESGRLVIPGERFDYEDIKAYKLPSFAEEKPVKWSRPDTLIELQARIQATTEKRRMVLEEVRDLGLIYPEGYDLMNDDLSNLVQAMEKEWMDCPLLTDDEQ